jgi:hypothetical protein
MEAVGERIYQDDLPFSTLCTNIVRYPVFPFTCGSPFIPQLIPPPAAPLSAVVIQQEDLPGTFANICQHLLFWTICTSKSPAPLISKQRPF